MGEQAKVIGTREVHIDSVEPHPANARRADLEALKASLKQHGQYAPIIVHEETRQVIAHNHVWKALRELGRTEVLATFVSCSEEKARAILLADNRTSDLGAYDNEALLSLLSGSYELKGTGYDSDDIDDLRALLEEMPAPPKAASSIADGDAKDKDLGGYHDDYEGSTTRSIVMIMRGREYVDLVGKLDALRDIFGTDSYTATIVESIARIAEIEEVPGADRETAEAVQP